MILMMNNLTIRSAEAEDAAQLCGWWNDGAVMAHAGFHDGFRKVFYEGAEFGAVGARGFVYDYGEFRMAFRDA